MMPDNFDVYQFLHAVIQQNAEEMRSFFEPDAQIFWSNTKEIFTVDEYIRVNCEYPDKWSGEIERVDVIEGYEKRMVFVARVWNTEGCSYHSVSFIEFGEAENELIQYLDEYWSDVTGPPEWRQKMKVGKIMDYKAVR